MGKQLAEKIVRDTPWEHLRTRLLNLGWSAQTTEGIDGLRSPNGAVSAHPNHINDRRLRDELLARLKRQVVGIQRKPAQNVPEGWEAGVLADFQQLVDGIEGLARSDDTCPNCGSHNVEAVPVDGGFMRPGEAPSAQSGHPDRRCSECGYLWHAGIT